MSKDMWVDGVSSQVLINSISDGFIALDENRRIVFTNIEFTTMLGYNEDELTGHKITKLLDKDNLKVLDDAEQKISENNPSIVEILWTSSIGEQICTKSSVGLLDGLEKGQHGLER